MSNSCGNCDCADKTQCPKNQSGYSLDIVETEKGYDTVFMEAAEAAENCGKCKCGSSCSCTNCTCGGH